MATLQGLSALKGQFDKLKHLDQGKALLAGAYVLQAESQKICPVRTGTLKNSARSDIVDTHAEMSYNTNYAFYVEEKVGWVRQTEDSKEGEIVKAVANQVQEQLRGLL